MIDSIDIKNHETHMDTVIENLHSGVNVITGESDDGKSGIIRAITWNAQNRPTGDAYRNDTLDPKKDKKKRVRVAIDYKSTGLVTRERDAGSINHYIINDQKPLKALRTDVPDEVQDVTRMKAVNIQGQHPSEQYFLLADKPGQVAKEFNKVAGLTVMDKALADINSQVRECNTKINISKKQMDELELELEASKWVPKAEKFAKKLKAFKEKFDNAIQTHNTILSSISQIKIVEDGLTEFQGIKNALWQIKLLSDENESISAMKSERTTLKNLILDVKKTDLQLADYMHTNIALKALKSLSIDKLKINKLNEEFDPILELFNSINKINAEVIKVENEYSKILNEYKITRETEECPVCGRKGNDEKSNT